MRSATKCGDCSLRKEKKWSNIVLADCRKCREKICSRCIAYEICCFAPFDRQCLDFKKKLVSLGRRGSSPAHDQVSLDGLGDVEVGVKNVEGHPYVKAFFFDAENIKFNWRMDEQQADSIHRKFTIEKLMDDLKKILELGGEHF